MNQVPDDKRGLNYTLLESYPYIVSFAGSIPQPFAMHLSRLSFFRGARDKHVCMCACVRACVRVSMCVCDRQGGTELHAARELPVHRIVRRFVTQAFHHASFSPLFFFVVHVININISIVRPLSTLYSLLATINCFLFTLFSLLFALYSLLTRCLTAVSCAVIMAIIAFGNALIDFIFLDEHMYQVPHERLSCPSRPVT